jgi:hypothetical protein
MSAFRFRGPPGRVANQEVEVVAVVDGVRDEVLGLRGPPFRGALEVGRVDQLGEDGSIGPHHVEDIVRVGEPVADRVEHEHDLTAVGRPNGINEPARGVGRAAEATKG